MTAALVVIFFMAESDKFVRAKIANDSSIADSTRRLAEASERAYSPVQVTDGLTKEKPRRWSKEDLAPRGRWISRAEACEAVHNEPEACKR